MRDLPALVCDSTNAMRDGVSPSEADVAVTLTRLIGEARQRVAVTTFASNVARIRSVAKATRAAGRELVVVGRAMYRVIEAAQATGYLDPDLPFHEEPSFRQAAARHRRGALHRQPGRVPRGNGAHRPGRTPQCQARSGRPGDLLLAHHPRQREGRGPRAERPRRQRPRASSPTRTRRSMSRATRGAASSSSSIAG